MVAVIGSLVARHTIGIVRAPLVDDGRGNEKADWLNAVTTPSEGWAIDAGNTAEDLDGRDSDTAEWTIRGPFDADVRPTDRIDLLGVRCSIVGAVMRQPGPSDLTSHTILRLKQVAG